MIFPLLTWPKISQRAKICPDATGARRTDYYQLRWRWTSQIWDPSPLPYWHWWSGCLQCAVCSVQCAAFCMQCAAFCMQCAVCSVQCRVPAMFEGEVLLATCTVVVRTVVYRIQNSKWTDYIPVVYSIQNSSLQCILDYFKVRDLSSFVQLCTMH